MGRLTTIISVFAAFIKSPMRAHTRPTCSLRHAHPPSQRRLHVLVFVACLLQVLTAIKKMPGGGDSMAEDGLEQLLQVRMQARLQGDGTGSLGAGLLGCWVQGWDWLPGCWVARCMNRCAGLGRCSSARAPHRLPPSLALGVLHT
eukprot:116690-Chlamydomonas_euryale.AAC.1